MKKAAVVLIISVFGLASGSASALSEYEIVSMPNFYEACQALFPEDASEGQRPEGYSEEDGIRMGAACQRRFPDLVPNTGGGGGSDGTTPACASPTECARLGLAYVASGGEKSFNETTQALVSLAISLIGLVAVVIIIIGGMNYSTSQGDAGKVKKAKDMILYGIIGLLVALIAFAIVNFVLGNISSA